MSIAILLVTHGQIGQSLLETAQYILKKPISVPIMNIAVTAEDMSVDGLALKVQQHCDQLNQGAGVLVLTDLVGATPFNGVKTSIKNQLDYPLKTITGLNLGMLLKAVSEISLHRQLDLNDNLVIQIQEGGRRSIIVPV